MGAARTAPDRDAVRAQYRTTRPLEARIALHARFSVNRQGWPAWLYEQIPGLDGRVLALGCGNALLWHENAARVDSGMELVLADQSAGMVRTSRERLACDGIAARYAILDARALPFAGRSRDVVLANHMLYHVPERPRALREIRRVLVPGGRLVASTLSEHNLAELWALAREVVGRELRDEIIAESFSLENGARQLEDVFEHVELRRYVDALEVTEVEPVLAYLGSVIDDRGFDAAAFDEIGARVRAEIQRPGAFRVGKDAGVFLAS